MIRSTQLLAHELRSGAAYLHYNDSVQAEDIIDTMNEAADRLEELHKMAYLTIPRPKWLPNRRRKRR